MSSAATAPVVLTEGRVHFVRGQRVMLDVDLAEVHRISMESLHLTVRRNRIRFPEDFMFRLTAQEVEMLMLPSERGGKRTLPYAFSEQGVAMLSLLVKSKKAPQLSVAIIRELAQNEEGSVLRLLTETLQPKKRRMGVFTPRAGAVNEY
jgi:hypothetical protein